MSHERLVMIQQDIHPGNFLIDPETGQVTILDFSGVSSLPETFASYTLYAYRNDFAKSISKIWEIKRRENLVAMSEARIINFMSGGGDFGLDKDGFPKKKKA
ncbi:hypothetical protein Clacol_005882 [Clathrus columnatus]|uniref:Uncharacterized protein n=1 Tax=Clathrus columnatus TaxID=1419009 RepID=A0AAV5AGN1_9AGAM|nr:hypothetical protein Clacol_005882 [Clathrus columnatus]